MVSWTDFIIYPLLFIALFFEVFAVLSFFEKSARERRKGTSVTGNFPTVSIIVPCFNEAETVVGTVESILALDYPKDRFDVIVVNDGSTDNTAEVLKRYKDNPQVIVIEKENGGKHTGLNAGIEISKSEFIACLDADSFVTPDALKIVMANFDSEKVGAVTSSMSVNAPTNTLEKMQEAEYLFGIMMRHTLATFNGLYVTPGPFTVYRKKVFQDLGPFRSAHQTEDMEIALRLQRGGWRIENAPTASVYTNAPKTVGGLVKQRTRWTTGFIRNSVDYRDLIGNPNHGILGLLVLPLAVLSVFSGIIIVFIGLYKLGENILEGLARLFEVPLSFSLTPQSFDLFFVPISGMVLISLVTIGIIFAFIFLGAKIAKKKTDFGFSIILYFLFYNLIAAVWQLRAVWDFFTGHRRSWR